MTGTSAPAPHVAGLHIHPVKGCRALDLDTATVEPWGLAGDRRWALIDPDGDAVTQRQDARLARVAVLPRPDGALAVSTDGFPALAVPVPVEAVADVKVTVWGTTVAATSAGAEADAWFSGLLERPVRLAYLDDPTRRPVDPDYAAPGDRVSFADGFPLLLTTTGSLDALNGWLRDEGEAPVPMNRFRPSVVVAGTDAWAEDGWRRVRIGSVVFRVAKPCGRCVVTTTDQTTGERGHEPLRMLGRRRRIGHRLVFGQNLIPDGTGVLRVGDEVQVLECE